MSISRSGEFKRRSTGARRRQYRMKRKSYSGKQPAQTKLGAKRVHLVRARGGNIKHRALRLDSGNFSWGSEVVARPSRILDVVYNATSNEMVRTKTLVKGAIVTIDATPFRDFYQRSYGELLPSKVKASLPKMTVEAQAKAEQASKGHTIDPSVKSQFLSNRLLARISSRPGQVGRADGYILEGPELDFYVRKMAKK
eukprot:gnl/Carplike_NY0171/349_a483_4908.p2 GENE.gnl/Carplike_NY0171/349_a483_4908~~gnl/Carplike_NY0171/349_a483_4908.p2  ORF type:complete len:197 (+),score=68.15 gnl/Carplike_NY0171/349_a483_4908:55-645(+)